MSDGPVIRTEQLTRKFGSFVAVRDVSFEVEKKEIFGYLGANGAGKSTTIRMLCGLLAPTAGAAHVNGIDVAASPERVKRSIGYMSQKFSLYLDLEVVENLEFFGGAYGLGGRSLAARIDEVLERVDLAHARRTVTRTLPGGTRQRLALASALLHRPSILFLDEPTAGVDPGARRNFWSLIRDLASDGTTVFVTTHYMDEAEYCGRIGLMVDGALVALDTPAELKRKHVPGKLCRVEGFDVPGALRQCRSIEGVIDAHAFGAGGHIRFDPDLTTRDDIQRRLLGAGLAKLTFADIDPTLEDVFLSVVEAGA